LDVSVLRASCRLLSSERVSSPLTIPPTVVLDLLYGGPDLDVQHTVGDLAGQHEAKRQDHCQRQPKRQRHDSQL